MDDDDLRRGVPTNHKIYGEATAILAGDALLTDAFNIIITKSREAGIDGQTLLDVIDNISYAAGSNGMIKGQSIDLEIEGNSGITLDELENLHSLKTGALIEASVISGALLGGAGDSDRDGPGHHSSGDHSDGRQPAVRGVRLGLYGIGSDGRG